MKYIRLKATITVFLMICSNGILAQPTLNQIELIKQFVGSWKSSDAKDTTKFYDIKTYGTGLEIDYKCVAKENTLFEAKILCGYNERVDKYLLFYLPEGADMQISAFWFVSNNKFVMIKYNDISNPKKAPHQLEGEFKSSETIVINWFANDKATSSENYLKVK